MKKIVFSLLALILFLIAASKVDFATYNRSECAFCDPKVLDNQVFYRGNGVLGVITHKPAVPGHVLIIPERHVVRFEELTQEEIGEIGEAIKKIDMAVRRSFGNQDYLLLQKNGRGAGQSVPHVHFHYLPGVKWLPVHFFLSPWLKPLKSEEVRLLKETLSESF